MTESCVVRGGDVVQRDNGIIGRACTACNYALCMLSAERETNKERGGRKECKGGMKSFVTGAGASPNADSTPISHLSTICDCDATPTPRHWPLEMLHTGRY